ncbi:MULTISPECIES: SIS domain-containing protein [Anaerococcus]|uniref:SIS domain-containing protein n=1 Tax=Anaerococcus TaxID=165779 RepID=UPI0008A2CBFC|nr:MULTISPECIES: SIS domain-containing protein [Anaerococcus]MBS6921229.1 SIS domain-containing protein [Anaerococcus vaginalis]MDU5560251.1 SIS domain-containing protein [Anaerococcus vaginalis]MDU5988015.1 SIS domain-containing protein [Anaerococcus vaginalis]MDU6181480.1 SIS domain-containing protein [Anaerococcus vaginalis]OFO41670.1 tagatose-6-phosphate ketose isomerase [Anaerococcus sp. HMSC075B03]
MLLDESKLEEKDFKYTYTEILNQADTWLEVYNLYEKRKNDIENFLKKVGKDCKVIFTGAGTSEYVGNIALDYLKTHGEFEFESVATTDLVSAPYLHFEKNQKTLLVSFARSGNSPESLAAVKLGKQIVDDFYNLPITCAKEGKLAQALKDDENSYVFLEPEITNDKGFAMTNSFSSMLLATLLIFDTKTKNKKEIVEKISKLGKEIYNNLEEIENLVNFDFNRVVYLGSGPLGKLTKEARLKILELTAGEVATIWESSMGFRHGPKSFVDENTLVISFVSSNPYTRLYDLDILDEIANDKIAKKIIGISNSKLDRDYELIFEEDGLDDVYLCPAYIIIGQIIALVTSLRVGNTPDNPSRTHTVNRVVKGVTIHDYKN